MHRYAALTFLRIMILAGLFLVNITGVGLAAPWKRLALVIGNGKYININPLANAPNDAVELEKRLKRLGFDVISAINADNRTFQTHTNEFNLRITPDSVALFFYAGHGVDVEGQAFLLPVDVAVENRLAKAGATKTSSAAGGVPTATFAIPLSKVTAAMSRSHILLVFLDACRDRPSVEFRAVEDDGRSRALTVTAGFQSRGVERAVPREAGAAPRSSNVFFIYSTSIDARASDGTNGNSPFTRALLYNIETENLTIEQLGRRIIDAVGKATKNKQTPWTLGSLKEEFSFNPVQVKTVRPTRARRPTPPSRNHAISAPLP